MKIEMESTPSSTGFLRIPNELANHFCRLHLSGNQWKCLWAIIRKTSGWNKPEDSISLTQFTALTGLDRRTVFKNLVKLRERGIIIKKPTRIITYALQADYGKWRSRGKIATSRGMVAKSPLPGGKIAAESSGEIATHKIQKDNRQKTKGGDTNTSPQVDGSVKKQLGKLKSTAIGKFCLVARDHQVETYTKAHDGKLVEFVFRNLARNRYKTGDILSVADQLMVDWEALCREFFISDDRKIKEIGGMTIAGLKAWLPRREAERNQEYLKTGHR